MIPTLSQIEAYTTDHLVDAAEYWDGLADRWEDAHWQVRNQAHSLDWRGFGGDAPRERTAPTAQYLTHRPSAGRRGRGNRRVAVARKPSRRIPTPELVLAGETTGRGARVSGPVSR
jgi:hypothetical protein